MRGVQRAHSARIYRKHIHCSNVQDLHIAEPYLYCDQSVQNLHKLEEPPQTTMPYVLQGPERQGITPNVRSFVLDYRVILGSCRWLRHCDQPVQNLHKLEDQEQ